MGAAPDQAQFRNDDASELFGATGLVHSVRELSFDGVETYCDGSGNCATRPGTLTAGPGYDSLTGLGTLGPDFVADLAAG